MTKQLTVYGLVQGVGFRPFALRLANELGVSGIVRNTGGVVEIIIQGNGKALDTYVRRLTCYPPSGSRITDYNVLDIADESQYNKFTIEHSNSVNREFSYILPDIATCPECEAELNNHKNRRYGHPFISCVNCGPRYSIIKKIPYDRDSISMASFDMCMNCENEYTNPADRRCHAQTIACKECGPKLCFYSNGQTVNDNALDNCITAIKHGKVVAVKDIGGYHFVCDAGNEEAVTALRNLKHREKKPFAVMFRELNELNKYAYISEEENLLLSDKARPIVLVKTKHNHLLPEVVCSGSRYIGAMYPGNPVQLLIMQECSPVIMTSGNISGEPIITDNSAMYELADDNKELFGVLSHERNIYTPLDDSICRVINNKVQITRRGRGYVPDTLTIESHGKKILASGGDLKSAFCIADGHNAVMSQYFGDLEDVTAFDIWKSNIDRLTELLDFIPDIYVCDMHPGYISSNYLMKKNQSIKRVQHHHAHIASVIAEHGLHGRILGLAFDGTGYGPDGSVWGGEVLLCESNNYERIAHLKSVRLVGGDQSAKNAHLAALAYKYDAGVESKDDDSYYLIKAAIENNINVVLSSSMGRLFDAVSDMLGLCSYNSYEGQCAIALENAAWIAIDNSIEPYRLELPLQNGIFQTDVIVRRIDAAVKQNADKYSLALGFHLAIVDAMLQAVSICKVNQIALSGGVFMNRILTEQAITKFEKYGLKVYINEKVPCNDGGLALGQAYLAGL